jgi:hypothetical protein
MWKTKFLKIRTYQYEYKCPSENKNQNSKIFLISCLRNSLIHSFVVSFIHNSVTYDHCFEAIYGQPYRGASESIIFIENGVRITLG